MVDLIVRQKLLLESVDAWLLAQASLVDTSKRALLSVLRERQALADGLARYLLDLCDVDISLRCQLLCGLPRSVHKG